MSTANRNFRWTSKLLRMIKKAHDSLRVFTSDYYVLPVNEESIRLDMALNRGDILIDYNQIDEIYIDQHELFLFLYSTGVFDLDAAIRKFTPVVAYDIDGVMADVESEIYKICPKWSGLNYDAPVDFTDFNYLGLPLKDKPTHKIDYIITSRPNQYQEDTRVWLERHNIDYKVLIFAEDKLSAMKGFEIDVLIDDNPATFEQVNQGGKVCYLYDCTYNRDVITSLRVHNLAQVEELI